MRATDRRGICFWYWGVLVPVISVSIACSSQDAGPSAPLVPIVGQGEGRFPSQTLTDWVSYSIQLAEIKVLSEKDIPPPRAVLDRKEGYIGRTIVVEVTRTFWSSTGAAPPVPTTFGLKVSGHVLKGEARIPFSIALSPRLEVGGSYVMALTAYTEDGEVVWSPLMTDTVFEMPGDPIATADAQRFGHGSVASELIRQPIEDWNRIMLATPPDPAAKRLWHLPPYDRYVAARRSEADGGAP
jgi:hypothetical protein